MKTNINDLIAENPSGLLEMKPSVTIPEYRNNFGFDLKNTVSIYTSKRLNGTQKDWFAFNKKSLEELISVQNESDDDLLVVFIIETIKEDRVHCHLLLSDATFKGMLDGEKEHVLEIHQMYSSFWKDHIAMNMATC